MTLPDHDSPRVGDATHDELLGTKSPPPRRSGRQLLIRLAKLGIAIAVLVGLSFAFRAASDQWQQQSQQLQSQIEQLDEEIEQTDDADQRARVQRQREQLQASLPRLENLRWRWIALASLLYGISLIPPGLLLHGALQTLGQQVTRRAAIAAQLLGHVGKYVPGKAMVVILRSGALAKRGSKVLPATVSIFMETFLMMAVGAAVAGFIVVWLPVPTWVMVLAIGISIAASLPTLPPVLKLVEARVNSIGPPLSTPGAWRLFAAGWSYSLIAWLVVGGSFTATIYAIPIAQPLPPVLQLYALATAAIALAMVVGFASLLPGGAGVRELVLAAILGTSLGPSHGLLAAIGVRIIFIVVEAGLASLAWLWLRWSKWDGAID